MMDIKINEGQFGKGTTFGTYSGNESNKKVLLYGKDVSDKVVYEVTYIFDNETQLTDYIAVDKEGNYAVQQVQNDLAVTTRVGALYQLKEDILKRIDKGFYKESSFIDFKNIIFNVDKLMAVSLVQVYPEDN